MSISKIFTGTAVAAAVFATTLPAYAGGFSHGGYRYHGKAIGSAYSGTKAKFKTKKVKYKSHTYADTGVRILFGGKVIEGYANAGAKAHFKAKGKSKYKSYTKAKSKVYAKAGNIMAKARSATHTKIYAAGKTYVVSHEVARAMTRFTPLGTTAVADATSYISASSSGYMSATTGTTTRATVRVKQ